MKLKLGFGCEEDQRCARAVRRALGNDIRWMADANHAYDASTALRLGRVLEENGYEWFEEPVTPEDIEGYRRLHEALDIPIAGGEAEFTRFGMKTLLKERCLDIVQPDCCGVGGLTEAKRVAVLANTFGIRCIPHVWGTRIALPPHCTCLRSCLPRRPPWCPLSRCWSLTVPSIHCAKRW
jgi:D-galactarolactone cycloisomerase